jgi:hypothetical protein
LLPTHRLESIMGLPFFLKTVRTQHSCSNMRTRTFTKANKRQLVYKRSPLSQLGSLRPKSKDSCANLRPRQTAVTGVALPTPFILQTSA